MEIFEKIASGQGKLLPDLMNPDLGNPLHKSLKKRVVSSSV